MKVFNTFFKITKKNIGTIIMYIAIFIGIASLTAELGQQDVVDGFEDSKVTMAVIDRDHTTTSQGIVDYLASTNTLVDLEDDMEVFQDELYYRNVKMIMIIPENFEANLVAGNDTKVESVEIPGSYYGIYIEIQLEQYLNSLRNYLNLGITPAEALTKTTDLMNQETVVTVQREETVVVNAPTYYRFFAIMPYAFVGIMVSIIGIILLVFNQNDLKQRTICSAISLKKRNAQLALGCTVLAFAILIILCIIPIFLYGTDMFSDSNYIFLLLNAMACMFVSIALGFLAGTISSKEEHIAIYSNTLSLGLNFLGGIFVPLSIMPESVVKVCKFIPTYWYSTTIDTLSANSSLGGKQLNDVIFGLLIQIGFAVVLFGISLVISRQKSQRA